MQNAPEATPNLFFDPFNETTGYEPETSFDSIFQRYKDGAVAHSYDADRFVADAEAIMLSAQFTEDFAAFNAIAARMHELCGEDHAFQSAMQASSMFGEQEHAHDSAHIHTHDDTRTQNAHENHAQKKKSSKEQKERRRMTFDQIIELLKSWRVMPKRP